MGKLIDYTDYLKKRHDDIDIEKTLAFTQVLHPKIEAVIEHEIEQLTTASAEYKLLKEDQNIRTSIEETVVTSLCYLLTQYLITLSEKPNDLKVTEDNFETFIENIIQGMIKTFKKKEI